METRMSFNPSLLAPAAEVPQNRHILHVLSRLSEERCREGVHGSPKPLLVHPDYIERLYQAVDFIPSVPVDAHGYLALAHPNGVLFAVAVGTWVIFLLLPPSDVSLWSGPANTTLAVDGWVRVDPWPGRSRDTKEGWPGPPSTRTRDCEELADVTSDRLYCDIVRRA
jgi:hypothetical protein